MMKPSLVYGLAAWVSVSTASAGDFPLTFRTVPAKEVMAFPGGSGAFGTLRQSKLAEVKKEPKAFSAHPLYGQWREGRAGAAFLFRADESKGDGKGYDRLIVDMNQNGDLTDDPVVERVVLPGERKGSVSDQALFGPIQAPEAKAVAGGRPVYYAQAYIYNTALLRRSTETRSLNVTVGQLRLKAGWYVDATVALDGLKQKVGVYDGNSNLRLGDIPQPQTYTNRGEKTWYFSSGDSLLLDADSSGTFENDAVQSEAFSFSPIVYFGPKAYKVSLAADNTSLRVEPWTETLAAVSLVPRGDQVRTVTLAWEQSDAEWQLLRVVPADGKIQVPPGNYRLYACELLGKSGVRDQVMASANQRTMQKPVHFADGQANSLRCGAPLEIKVTAERAKPNALGLLSRRSTDSKQDSEFELRVNAQVFGGGGEAYSSYRKGEKLRQEPPKPTFTIVDTRGRKVKDGNLEFG
jgi:hypothetical protein